MEPFLSVYKQGQYWCQLVHSLFEKGEGKVYQISNVISCPAAAAVSIFCLKVLYLVTFHDMIMWYTHTQLIWNEDIFVKVPIWKFTKRESIHSLHLNFHQCSIWKCSKGNCFKSNPCEEGEKQESWSTHCWSLPSVFTRRREPLCESR